MHSEQGTRSSVDVSHWHVGGARTETGTVDFDGASLTGTACSHGVPQNIPNDLGNPLSLERD